MANTVSILGYANTFGEWVVTTNALAKENNDLAANTYVKPTGTLFLNDSTLGLQVATRAIVGGQLQVQGVGSSAYIQNNMNVGSQVYLTNTQLGLVNFECNKCQAKVEMSSSEIKVNNTLKNEIEKKVSNPKMQKLKEKFDSCMNEFQSLLDQINKKSEGEFLLKICDHFETLRNEIDIKREIVLEELIKENSKQERIEEIHELSERFIRSIESTEKEFRQNFTKEIQLFLNELQQDIEKMELENSNRNLSIITKKNVKKIQKQCESKLNHFKFKFVNIEKKLNSKLKLNRFQ